MNVMMFNIIFNSKYNRIQGDYYKCNRHVSQNNSDNRF